MVPNDEYRARVPEGLSDRAKELWDQAFDTIVIDNAVTREVLANFCYAFDRREQARAAMAADGAGPVMKDRFEQAKLSPWQKVEADAFASMRADHRALGLDQAPKAQGELFR